MKYKSVVTKILPLFISCSFAFLIVSCGQKSESNSIDTESIPKHTETDDVVDSLEESSQWETDDLILENSDDDTLWGGR